MPKLLIATLMLLSTCSAYAANKASPPPDIVGRWNAITGMSGEMNFRANGTVDLAPSGVPGLTGAYALTGEWLEIRPTDGRPPATMRISCKKKTECTLLYPDGTSQIFERKPAR